MAAVIQTLDRAEATRLRTAAGAIQAQARVHAALPVIHGPADSAAAAGLRAAAVQGDPSAGADRARLEAAVAVAGGKEDWSAVWCGSAAQYIR